MADKQKVLTFKTYNKIPHFSTSRLGPGDHFIDKNAEKCCLSQVPDNQTLIIVQEKLDGTNVSVYRDSATSLAALTRSGYRCEESEMEQHKAFYRHVKTRQDDFFELLGVGERVVGEWLALAHGTKYIIYDEWNVFRPFDLFTAQNERLNYHEFLHRVLPNSFFPPAVLHIGGACSTARACKLMDKLVASNQESKKPFHVNGEYEGFIYRVERAGVAKEIIKFVHHDKVDAKYLIDECGHWIGEDKACWNFDPKLI